MSNEWIVGRGHGLTGPTTSTHSPVVAGSSWPTLPVSCGFETIAIVVAQEVGPRVPEDLCALEKRARLIAAAPALLEALEGFIAIAGDSRGVAGYHLNGAIADWDEFEAFDAAIAAIKQARGES